MKCRGSDAGDAVGNRDAGQIGAGLERRVADVRDAGGNCVVPSLAARTLNEQCLAFVEQNSIRTAKERIQRIHRDDGQAGA